MREQEVERRPVGFCGLGRMGLPMTQRLIDAGRNVAVWNRSFQKAQSLERTKSPRCLACERPAELAQKVDIVLLCLANGDAVEEVAFGEAGLATASNKNPLIVVDHSTLTPSQTRSIATRWRASTGGTWIDAPVSGGTAGAATGTLAVMLGGDTEAVDAVKKVISAYATNMTHMGEAGAGQATKLANQTIVMTTIAGIAEATRLTQDAGVDACAMPAALAGGWADSVLLRTLQPRMMTPPDNPTGSIVTMLKDLDAVQALAYECNVNVPVVMRVRDWLVRAVECGFGESDISQIINVDLP